MNCEDFSDALEADLDGTLPADRIDALRQHAGECVDCGRDFEQAVAVHTALASLPAAPMRPEFPSAAMTRASRGKKSLLAGRLIAAAFVATLLLSVVTVILTGLSVTAPRTEIASGLPTVTMQVDESRTINLVFDSRLPLDDVSLLVTLPRGVELQDYPGQTQIEWTTALVPGRNVVPLPLRVGSASGGQLVAQLGHGDRRKVFRVHVEVTSG